MIDRPSMLIIGAILCGSTAISVFIWLIRIHVAFGGIDTYLVVRWACARARKKAERVMHDVFGEGGRWEGRLEVSDRSISAMAAFLVEADPRSFRIMDTDARRVVDQLTKEPETLAIFARLHERSDWAT